MYGNTPPSAGVVVPGALAVTGVDGLQGLGLSLTALALVISGALLLRNAYLRRVTEAP
jgi:hypothetical protein